jgi:hypothetical protein
MSKRLTAGLKSMLTRKTAQGGMDTPSQESRSQESLSREIAINKIMGPCNSSVMSAMAADDDDAAGTHSDHPEAAEEVESDALAQPPSTTAQSRPEKRKYPEEQDEDHLEGNGPSSTSPPAAASILTADAAPSTKDEVKKQGKSNERESSQPFASAFLVPESKAISNENAAAPSDMSRKPSSKKQQEIMDWVNQQPAAGDLSPRRAEEAMASDQGDVRTHVALCIATKGGNDLHTSHPSSGRTSPRKSHHRRTSQDPKSRGKPISARRTAPTDLECIGKRLNTPHNIR